MTVYNLVDTNSRRVVDRALAIAERIDIMLQSIKDARTRRKAIHELEMLSDAQLIDIGIPRYAIRDFVEATFSENAKPQSSHNANGRRDQYCDHVELSKTGCVT